VLPPVLLAPPLVPPAPPALPPALWAMATPPIANAAAAANVVRVFFMSNSLNAPEGNWLGKNADARHRLLAD
jgi:hypothetical protein